MTEFESELLKEIKALRLAIEQLGGMPIATKTVVPKDETLRENTIDKSQPQTATTTTAIPINVTRYYFGTPDGPGFEHCNIVADPDSPKALYVVETLDGKSGRFYPLTKSLTRLKSNAKSFLLPLCEIQGPIDELESVSTTPEKYGELTFDGEFWTMTKKCQIG